ncbi:MAG: hypothetical protein Q9195_000863 [Heterodermia aff. obscurata]
MAERTATRASSRLITPQSPLKADQATDKSQQTATRRSTRAARSQSRDVSDSEATKASGKGGRRGARQANARGAEVPGKPGRKGKVTALPNNDQIDPELSVLAEVVSMEDPELKPNFGPTLEGIAQAAESPFSAFSGTTARTSRSAQEPKGSSALDLLDALPDLSYAADQVLNWLLPSDEVSEEAIAGICDQLQDNSSRTGKNVVRLGKSFQMQKDVYGGKPFMKPSIVVSALIGSSEIQGNGSERWRPDPLLHKANLTSLILLITRPWEIDASSQLLEFLDQNFPTAFSGQLSTDEDFAIALEIRTHYFIIQLARYIHELNFDPDMLLSQVFQINPTAFKGWDGLGLQAQELTEEQSQAIALRFQGLGQNFSDGSNVDPEALKNAYPWLSFVTRIMAWSKKRLADIEAQVNAQGGTSEIINALDQEIQARIAAGLVVIDNTRSDIQLQYPSPSQLSTPMSDKIELNRIATIKAAERRSSKLIHNSAKTMGRRVARLKEMEKAVKKPRASRKSSAVSIPNSTFNQPFAAALAPMSNASFGGPAPTANMMPMVSSAPTFEGMAAGNIMDDGWQPQQIEEEMGPGAFEDDFTRSQRIVALGEEREAAANKENMAETADMQAPISPGGSQRPALAPRKLGIMDPQPNAQRVTFDSQVFQDIPESSRGTKRAFDETMDAEGVELEEPSQDQGFQQDNRTFDVASRRVQKPVQAPRRRTKKARTTQTTQTADDSTQDFTQPEPTAQDDGIPRSTIDNYHTAKLKSQEFTAGRPKKVQVRKAWTDEETGLLLDLIEEHGTSWRLLKQIDAENDYILKDRDQVALKDKARNMKLDFLK